MDSARRTLRQMRELGYTPDLISYNTLISGYAALGETVMAKAVIGVYEVGSCAALGEAISALLGLGV